MTFQFWTDSVDSNTSDVTLSNFVPKIMKFLQRFVNKITELRQLDLPQSEVCISSYKINKATVSAVFTDSGSFIVSCITPRI